MDSVLEALAEVKIPKPENRLNQYKQKGNAQEKRRKQYLDAIKEKRYNYTLHARCLADGNWPEHDKDSEMEWNAAIPTKLTRAYKNQIMLSEWLFELPHDLQSEWLMVLCPVGKRCLVVASKGETKAFAKNGWRMNVFPSWLPGGSRRNSHQNSYSILDCVYNREEKTFYILDLMCWRSHPIFDSETEFRFYWLQDKLAEVPELQSKTIHNPFKFHPLASYSCEKSNMCKILSSSLPFPSKLDGILFYHKRSHYLPGPTPLVGWLKAFMIPELFDFPVPENLCTDKPIDYISMKAFLDNSNETLKEMDVQ